MKRSYEPTTYSAAPAPVPAQTSPHLSAPSTPRPDANGPGKFENYGYGPRHPSHEQNRQAEAQAWAAQNAAQQAAQAQVAQQAAVAAQQQAAQAFHQSQMRNASGLAPLYPSYGPGHQHFPSQGSYPPVAVPQQQQPMTHSPPSKRPRYDSNGSNNAAASPPPLPMNAQPPPPPTNVVRPVVDPSRGNIPPRPNVFPAPYTGPSGPMHGPPMMPPHQPFMGGPPPMHQMHHQPGPSFGNAYPPLPMRPGPPPSGRGPMPMDGRRMQNGSGRAPLPPQRMPNAGRAGQTQRGRGGGAAKNSIERGGRTRQMRRNQANGVDEKRRAFSDFRISSIEIVEIDWSWQGDPFSRTPSIAPDEPVRPEIRGKHAREDDSEEDRDAPKKVKAEATDSPDATTTTVNAAASPDLSTSVDQPKSVAESNGSLARLPDEPVKVSETDAEAKESVDDIDGAPADLDEISRAPSPSPSVASTVGKVKKSGPGSGREGNRLRIYFGAGSSESTAKFSKRPPIPTRPEASDGGDSKAETSTADADVPSDLQVAAEAASGSISPVEPKEPIAGPSTVKAATVKEPTSSSAPSADRISISYAKNTRRMLIDAAIVERVSLHRAEHRIELLLHVMRTSEPHSTDEEQEDTIFKGLTIEAMDAEADDFVSIDKEAIRDAWSRDRKRARSESAPVDGAEEPDVDDAHDELLPPLHRLQIASSEEVKVEGEEGTGNAPTKLSLIIQLDKANPLGEPKWVRTGQVDEWIAQAAGKRKDEGAWRGKIVVVDPEPPPTFEHALKTWVESTSLDAPREDLQRFTQTHMQEPGNVIEVLLRIIRGDARQDRPGHVPSTVQPPAVAKMARDLQAPYASHQTHVSLATFALYKLAVESAGPPGSDSRKAADKRVGEIVRALPYHLVFRVLDAMAKEVLRL